MTQGASMHIRRASRALWTVVVIALAALPASAEAPRQSPAGESRPPKWNQIARLPDGRVLVTDGNIVLDVAFANPATTPTDPVGTAWLQAFLSTAQPHEVPVRDLTSRSQGTTRVYATPQGMILNPEYVDYLRALIGDEKLRFRCNGVLDPVQIVVNSAVVGALMPMKP